MAQISAGLVKELRDKTGAGMMDCKKALGETGGNLEEAVDWLRKKGLAAAAKKAGRVAAEGLVAVAAAGAAGVIVEVNAETDFVSRNEQFQGFASAVAAIALGVGDDMDALNGAAYPGSGRTVAEERTHLVATIGENMNLRRAKRLAVETGLIATYVHNTQAPGLGKIGVLVALQSTADAASLAELGKSLAMHVAAANPQFLSVDDVGQEVLDRERSVLMDQARATGKPEEIVAKMVERRLRRYYEEVVLLNQVHVVDGKTKVAKVVDSAAKRAGVPITLAGFARFQLGEGIDKPTADFAAEVAAQVSG